MKTTWILALLLIALVLVYALLPTGKRASLGTGEVGFSVADTAAVSRVVLTRVVDGQAGSQLVLQRQAAGGWLVNGRFRAFQPRVNTLLETLHLLHVRQPLPEAGQQAGRQLLARQHIRIEVFDEGGLHKSIQLGTPGKDGKGSLMMLQGARAPYLVEIPGWNGYLNSRFDIEEAQWRVFPLFPARLPDIQAIALHYPDTAQSFRLSRSLPQAPWSIQGAQAASHTIQNYLQLFQQPVYAARRAPNALPPEQAPLLSIQIAYFSGDTTEVRFFSIPSTTALYLAQTYPNGPPLLVQAFVMDKFFKKKSFFLKE